jgi:hypothetical protein
MHIYIPTRNIQITIFDSKEQEAHVSSNHIDVKEEDFEMIFLYHYN